MSMKTNTIATIQTLLRSAIRARLDVEYMAPGASPAQRSYYEGRIAALLACMTEGAEVILGKARTRYATEHHAPGDDITYPEGTSVQWLVGCIQAAQDVVRGENEQRYGSPVIV